VRGRVEQEFMHIIIRFIIGAFTGAGLGAAIAWLSCGTVSYLIDPDPEMVHPFYFAANLGAMIGAPFGLFLGVLFARISESPKPSSD
jgi:hypothetical protein